MQFAATDNIGVSVVFPGEFGASLVKDLALFYCRARPVAKQCGIVGNREVRFDTFERVIQAGSLMQFAIYGVANPPKGETGQFIIKISDRNTGRILASNDGAGSFRILDIPNRLDILSITASTLSAGESATYTFSINTNMRSLIPNGAIWIDWPLSYISLFSEAFSYSCAVAPFWTASSSCNWLVETNLLRTEVLLPMPTALNQQSTVAQTFNITIKDVPNPKAGGATTAFEVRYVDLSTRLVRASSFGVLGANTLTLQAGPGTITTRDVFSVAITKGTWSNLIPMEMGLPAADLVAVLMSSDNPGLIFYPTKLHFQYTWQTSGNFSIAAGSDAKVGTWSVFFSKLESGNYVRFSPLRDLQIQVIEATGTLPITVGTVPRLSTGLSTLPIAVTLGQPTLYPVTVEIYTTLPEHPELEITPSHLDFTSGMQTLSFVLTPGQGVLNGTLAFATTLSMGSAPYMRTAPSVEYLVDPPSEAPLVVSSVNVTETTRNSATVQFNLTAQATIYYLVASGGAATPTAAQLKDQSKVNSSGPQFFGTVYTFKGADGAFYSTAVPTDLTDDSLYVFFFTLQGSDKSLNSTVTVLPFRTQPSQKPATFIIFLTIALSSSAPSPATVHPAVCKALFVPCNLLRFVRNVQAALNSGNRRLQSSSLGYEFILSADRTQNVIEPVKQVAILDQNKDLLAAFLPSFDPTQTIASTAAELNVTSPLFLYRPKVVVATNTTLSISLIQDSAGFIYGVALNRHADPPRAEQILQGLDANNLPVSAGHFQSTPCVNQTMATLKFTHLEPFRRYRVWFAGVNNMPGYPQVTSDADVVYVNVSAGRKETAIETPVVLYGYDDWAVGLKLAAGALLVALLA